MFTNLTNRLNAAFKVLKGQGKITEVNIGQTLKEVRRALLEADVSYKVSNEFIKRIKQKAIGQKVQSSLQPKQLFIKIVHDELMELMGSKNSPLPFQAKPLIILLVGLQGTGKTTIAGKLAKELKQKHQKTPLLVACDVYRPAAMEQLEILSQKAQVNFYADQNVKNPVKIARQSLSEAKTNGNNAIIIDTAGRLAIDQKMMEELKQIKHEVQPHQTLFILDAMMGQDAVNTAKTFHEQIDFDGVILSKLDSDARGGAALSVMTTLEKPIKYVGIGEKLDDLEAFHPQRMAKRILGMGDIVSLVEKSKEAFDQQQAEKILKKASKNQFDLNDLMTQLQGINKMGGLKAMSHLLPSQMSHQANGQQTDQLLKEMKYIYDSMTSLERSNPKIINHSRKIRIAKGSGRDMASVNQLLKVHQQLSKIMKMGLGGKAKMLSKMKL
ncbi:MAG: signal recognition particle protein [Flavobacteriaceae bacterium]|nr:signal recognition particle protein [Flavobacteriaceae bacterium]